MDKLSAQLRHHIVTLLKIDAEHERTVRKMEVNPGIQLDGLRIELLDPVLDLIGVPFDNSSEVLPDHPDFVCRDFLLEKWMNIVEQGSDEDIEQFPNWVIEQIRAIESHRAAN